MQSEGSEVQNPHEALILLNISKIIYRQNVLVLNRHRIYTTVNR